MPVTSIFIRFHYERDAVHTVAARHMKTVPCPDVTRVRFFIVETHVNYGVRYFTALDTSLFFVTHPAQCPSPPSPSPLPHALVTFSFRQRAPPRCALSADTRGRVLRG